MKKKIAFLVVILQIMLIFAICLTSCTPTRPDKYIIRLNASNDWGVTIFNSDDKVTGIEARNGNLRYSYGVNAQTYLKNNKTSIEIYRCKDKIWTYNLIQDSESLKEYQNVFTTTVKDLELTNLPDLDYITNDFLNKFEKREGKWYERNTMPACLYVKGGSLYYTKGGVQVVYTIGYNLQLSDEAKNAKK